MAPEGPRPSRRASDSPEFSVSLENFTGPFDVLLSLISRRELDLTQVALSAVTDEFLAFTADLMERSEDPGRPQEDLERLTSFIVVASALLEIKASLLLPQESAELPEKLRALEEQDLLFSRLLQYRAFQEAATYLAERLQDEAAVLGHPPSPLPESPGTSHEPEEPEQIAVQQLWALAESALQAAFAEQQQRVLQQRDALAHIHADAFTVEEESHWILNQLRASQGRLGFEQAIAGSRNRVQMVVRFLALLELFRQERIELEQEGPRSAITIRTPETTPGTPPQEGP